MNTPRKSPQTKSTNKNNLSHTGKYSALMRLYHKQAITYAQVQAGLRFKNDFERSRIHTLRAINIFNIVKTATPNKQYTLYDAQLDAQNAYHQALNQVPENICKYILTQFCCYDVPLSHLDHHLRWRKGKASTRLKNALTLLSNHYNNLFMPY